MIMHTRLCGAILASLFLCGACAPRDVSYSADVQPILKKYCLDCHVPCGPGYDASGFDMSSHESLMKGGKYGAFVIPGDPFGSNLMVLVEKILPDMSQEPLPPPFLQLDENAQPSSVGRFRSLSRSVAFRLITLVFLLTALVLTSILVVFGYLLSRDARHQADQQINSSVQTLATNYQIWLESSQNALLNLAAQPDIQSMQAQRQQPVLAALVQTHPYMYLVSTVDLSGVNVARSDLAELVNYSERVWFEEASSGKEIAYQTVLGGTSGQPGLVVATPIRREGEVVGVAMFAADLEQVSRIVEQARLGETGVAYVIDPMNRVVAKRITFLLT